MNIMPEGEVIIENFKRK